VPFDPPAELEPSTNYYGGKRYEEHFGKASPDDVPLHPRYLYDPIFIHTPQKGYVATVHVGGLEYRSAPTDLVAGVNLVAVQVGALTRYVVAGAPTMVRAYKKNKQGGY
jgi:hypothetical protein